MVFNDLLVSHFSYRIVSHGMPHPISKFYGSMRSIGNCQRLSIPLLNRFPGDIKMLPARCAGPGPLSCRVQQPFTNPQNSFYSPPSPVRRSRLVPVPCAPVRLRGTHPLPPAGKRISPQRHRFRRRSIAARSRSCFGRQRKFRAAMGRFVFRPPRSRLHGVRALSISIG